MRTFSPTMCQRWAPDGRVLCMHIDVREAHTHAQRPIGDLTAHTYIYINTYIYPSHTYTPPSTNACELNIHVHMRSLYTYTHGHRCMHAYAHMHAYVCPYSHMQIYIHIHTSKCVLAYTRTYTHMYTPIYTYDSVHMHMFD